MALFQKKQKEEVTQGRRPVAVRRKPVQSYGTYTSQRQNPSATRNQEERQVRNVRRLDEDSSRGEAQQQRGNILRSALRKRRVIIGAGVLAGMLLLLSLVGLSGSPTLIVKQTSTNAPLLHSQDEYTQKATQLIADSFANRNKITFDRVAVERGMLNAFPELLGVEVMLPIFGFSPVLTVRPSPPAAVLQTAGSGNFIIDSSGFAVSNNEAAVGIDLPLLIDQTGLALAVGDRALPSGTMNLITKLSYQLSKKDITVESFILPAQSAYELNVRTSGTQYFAKLSTEDAASFDQQIGSYLSLRQYLEEKRITPAEYVDVRILGRAYYK